MGEVAVPHPHPPLPDQFNSIPTVDSTIPSLSLPEENTTETETMKHPKDSISAVDSIDSPKSDVSSEKSYKTETVILPEHLPKPEAPPGLLSKSNSISHEEYHTIKRSTSANVASSVDMASIGRFFRDQSDVVSAAIARRISSLKETSNGPTEIHLPDVKVIVKAPGKNPSAFSSLKGRVSFFSRSGCRDCTAVRSFFREIELPYVEINVDVFPEREQELVDRTGTNQVPQIFLNEKHLGGLVVLNSLRNSGEFENVLKSMAGTKVSDDAPMVPVYGFDHEEAEKENLDEMVAIVAVLRPRMPIQDRFVRMKLVRNCFSGADMVDAIVQHVNLGREKAAEIGKELLRRHFIHHVFREIDFEDDAQQLYRFLEHDPGVLKYFNFRMSTNDNKPKSPAVIGQLLTKLMVAMLESYASDDRHHVDYARIAVSEEFRRYGNLVRDLQRVDMAILSETERLCFFLNLYNAMVVHAVVTIGQPGLIDRRAFFTDFQYIIGGYPYSLSTIKNGILRSNRRQPYSFVKPFSSTDIRLELMPKKMNPLIHFGLCNGNRSSPAVRFFTPDGVEVELRQAARDFFKDGGINIDFTKRTVYLSRIFKWYSADFGQDKLEVLNWVLNYLDSTKAGLLSHLLNDGGAISISYQSFDWSLNC
ncbi:hypothetical protein LUZ62_061700 [Rhynchospora pubera]|uniref:DEP domain-containing protein n=1 Tax=Rhynchospora pubera TaxID=906938 RepID=A0AAV8EG86_9POAL|nr:hypothetical protein LUZ62_061700 [Rhynchospora pubera]